MINLNRDFKSINLNLINNILSDLYNFLQFKKENEKHGKRLMKYSLKYSTLSLGFQIMDFISNVGGNNKTNSRRYSFYSNTYKIALHKNDLYSLNEEFEQHFNNKNYYTYKKIHGLDCDSNPSKVIRLISREVPLLI